MEEENVGNSQVDSATPTELTASVETQPEFSPLAAPVPAPPAEHPTTQPESTVTPKSSARLSDKPSLDVNIGKEESDLDDDFPMIVDAGPDEEDLDDDEDE